VPYDSHGEHRTDERDEWVAVDRRAEEQVEKEGDEAGAEPPKKEPREDLAAGQAIEDDRAAKEGH